MLKLIKNKFKNGISSHEDYGDSVWFSVYGRKNDDGTFSFVKIHLLNQMVLLILMNKLKMIYLVENIL